MLLDEVKQYLRLEPDYVEEDFLLDSLILAAGQFIKSNTGIAVNVENDLHVLAIRLLVSHWYENREVVGKADKLAYSLDSILFQMNYGDG